MRRWRVLRMRFRREGGEIQFSLDASQATTGQDRCWQGFGLSSTLFPRTQLLLCTQARVYTQIRTWSACRVSREPRPVYNFPNIVRSGKTPWKCFVSGPRSHLGTHVPTDTPFLRWRDFYSIEIEPQAFHRVSNSAVIRGGVFSIKFRRVDEQLVN